MMRCGAATSRSRRASPSWCATDSPSRKVGAAPAGDIRQGAPCRADAVARQRLHRRGRRAISSAASAASSAWPAEPSWRSPPSRRSTGCRCRCAMKRQAGARRDARRRHDRRKRHRQCPHHRRNPATAAGRRAGVVEVRGEVYMSHDDFAALNAAHGRERQADLRQSAQHRGRLACASSIPTITAARPLQFFAYAWGEISAMPAETQIDVVAGIRRLGLPDQSADGRCRTVEEILAHYHEIEAQARRRSATTSTASSTRSTGSTCSRASASSRAARAGRSPTSSPPSRRRRSSTASTSRSAAPAR